MTDRACTSQNDVELPRTELPALMAVSRYRRYWLPDLIVVCVLLVTTPIVFQFTDIDLRVARLFYDPDNPADPWPLRMVPLWNFFYHSARWVVGLLGLLALAGIAAGTVRRRWRSLRMYSACVILTVALGPGIMVNGILKNYWGRPRPRQVTEFNGVRQYHGPLEKGIPGGGKSLPCGHSSTGFVYCVFYFILRRKRPRTAFAILGGTAAFGTLMGIGRIAAGAHFLSDVLLSAYLPFLSGLLVHYFILRIPQREDAGRDDLPWLLGRIGPRMFIGITAVGLVVLVATVLLASPFREDLSISYPVKWVDTVPTSFDLTITHANVTLELLPESEYILWARGKAQGFGYPTNEILETVEFQDDGRLMIYTFNRNGVFSEYECHLHVRLLDRGIERVRVAVDSGNISVVQPAHRETLPTLDVTTEDGTVILPSP